MADRTETITILIKAIDETKSELSKVQSNISSQVDAIKEKLSSQKEELALARSGVDVTQSRTRSEVGFLEVMSMNLATYKDYVNQGARGATVFGKFGMQIRNLTQGMRGFRMEMLGVMFFGMGMQQTLMGLLQPAMEAAGIFEILSTILEVLFLPVALALLDPLLAIMDWFMNLPEGVQMAIGTIALLGVVLGTALMALGTFALGIGSAIEVFAPFIAAILSVTGPMAGIGLAIQGVIGFLLSLAALPFWALIGLLLLGVSQNFENFKIAVSQVFSAIGNIIEGFQVFFGGFIELIQGLLELDAEKAFHGFKTMVQGVLEIVKGLFLGLIPAIGNVFASILYGIGKFFVGLPSFILSFAGKIWDAIAGLLPEPFRSWMFGIGKAASGLYEGMYQAFMSLPRAISAAAGAIADAIWSVIPEPFRSWLKAGVSLYSGFYGAMLSPLKGSPLGNWLGLAEGGIVTSPTLAMVGERGPEAVIPLSGNNSLLSNITINATIASDIDINRLADVVSSKIGSDYRRLTYR